MRLVRCDTPRTFLERAEPFLLADEACHNLLLSAPAILVAQRPARASAPYFAVVVSADDVVVTAAIMVPPHRLVLSRTAWPQSPALIAQDLLAAGMRAPGVHGPTPVGQQFAEAWQQLSGQRHERAATLCIYRLGGVRSVSSTPGQLRPATLNDRELLMEWMRAFQMEAFGPHAPPTDAETVVGDRLQGTTGRFYLWEHDGPRACAGYAGATRHGVRVGPVYTPPQHRRRGYACAAVAALSQLLLDRGHRFCCLYADLANPTSNRLYERIGYEPVCEVSEYRFLPAP